MQTTNIECAIARDDRLLSPAEVERITLLSDRSRKRRERRGAFPRRVRLGEAGSARNVKVAYIASEIHAWLSRVAASRSNISNQE